MRPIIRSLTLTVLLAFAPLAAQAAEAPAAPTTSLADAPGGKYLLDKTHASIVFSISHLGFSQYKGRFNDFDATLFLDKTGIEKSGVKVTVDVASVDTNNTTLEGKLRSDTFFDTKKYPEASFNSTSFEKLSDTKGTLKGMLSLHGVTRPVTLDVTLNGIGVNPFSKKPTIGFAATTSIKRSDFGIKEYLPAVGDDVTLMIDAEFAQAD